MPLMAIRVPVQGVGPLRAALGGVDDTFPLCERVWGAFIQEANILRYEQNPTMDGKCPMSGFVGRLHCHFADGVMKNRSSYEFAG